jgi:uncharacterized protein YuzE
MKVIYDPETDSLSLILREGHVAESDELRDGLIIDYDKKGRIIAIEVLDASESVSEPKSIVYEMKGLKQAV